eukprot:scaffold301104_cov23-Tisochrysis_lutea.AAC.1
MHAHSAPGGYGGAAIKGAVVAAADRITPGLAYTASSCSDAKHRGCFSTGMPSHGQSPWSQLKIAREEKEKGNYTG